MPLFYERQSDEYIQEAIAHCGEHTVLTHYGAWNFSQDADGKVIEEPSPSFGGQTNYKSFFQELDRIGYDGYLVSEYCLPAIKDHRYAGIEEIDKANKLSLQYMKDLLKPATPSHAKVRASI